MSRAGAMRYAADMSKIWQALKAAESRREGVEEHDGLSRAQRDAVQALLVHASVDGAARACGVSAGTLEGWLKTPVFVAAYHVASRAARARR